MIWGEPGSNAQHSFFQLLHQGTAQVSLDLIAVARGGLRPEQQQQALANLLAQAEAFARGRDAGAVQRELSQAGLSSRIESPSCCRTRSTRAVVRPTCW